MNTKKQKERAYRLVILTKNGGEPVANEPFRGSFADAQAAGRILQKSIGGGHLIVKRDNAPPVPAPTAPADDRLSEIESKLDQILDLLQAT